MIEVIKEEFDNKPTHFKLIIYNAPAGLSNKNEEDILDYLVNDFNITPDDSMTASQIILQDFPDYTLPIGQEKLSYEFVFKTKEFSEEDYYYSDEEDEQEEQEPIEEENIEELEDELWEQYMDFLKFGKQRNYFKLK